MKILVIGDTHRNISNAIALLENDKTIDRIFHLGDHVTDAEDLQSIYPQIPIDFVKGNCDFLDEHTPEDKIIELHGKRIWITHGHMYGVKREYDTLFDLAKQKKVDAVLFGHTHIPIIEITQNIIIMNPGSIAGIRTPHGSTYGILEIDKRNQLHGTIAKQR